MHDGLVAIDRSAKSVIKRGNNEFGMTMAIDHDEYTIPRTTYSLKLFALCIVPLCLIVNGIC